jgi:hypothetical protein
LMFLSACYRIPIATSDSGNDTDGGQSETGTLDGGGHGCVGYNGTTCAPNTSCQTGVCSNGDPVSCLCNADGTLSNCTGACPPNADGGMCRSLGSTCDSSHPCCGAYLCINDGGGPTCHESLPPNGCVGYNGTICAPNSTCQTGACSDGSPVTCLCNADGTLSACTGACPPDSDGGGVCRGPGESCDQSNPCCDGLMCNGDLTAPQCIAILPHGDGGACTAEGQSCFGGEPCCPGLTCIGDPTMSVCLRIDNDGGVCSGIGGVCDAMNFCCDGLTCVGDPPGERHCYAIAEGDGGTAPGCILPTDAICALGTSCQYSCGGSTATCTCDATGNLSCGSCGPVVCNGQACADGEICIHPCTGVPLPDGGLPPAVCGTPGQCFTGHGHQSGNDYYCDGCI